MQQSCSAWRTWDLAGVREPFIRFSGFFMDTKCWAGVLYKIQKTKKRPISGREWDSWRYTILKILYPVCTWEKWAAWGNPYHLKLPSTKKQSRVLWFAPLRCMISGGSESLQQGGEKKPWEPCRDQKQNHSTAPYLVWGMALDWFAHLKKF